MSWNPEHDRQDAIETACHNAIRAMHDQATIAHRDGRSPEACLILAAALNQLVLQDITGEQLTECIIHLTRQASPLAVTNEDSQQHHRTRPVQRR